MLTPKPHPQSRLPLGRVPHVLSAPSVEGLARALNKSYDGVISERPLPSAVKSWLEKLAPQSLPEGRFVLRPSLAGTCIAALFEAHGIAPCPSLSWLSQDVQALANQISLINPSERLRLRLEPVSDDACTKMHIDAVVARLICTYRGPGTVLGVQSGSIETEEMVPTGAPMLFKGKHWPADTPPTLRHRSPRISGTGITRLVLVLEGCSNDALLPTHDSIYGGGSISV